jgi:class 3 adenylate cyclase
MAGDARKTVTVVFTDVTGSTSLGESLDPEALRGVMSSYFDTAQAVLEKHGGTVEKFIGDAVMAVSESQRCTRTVRCVLCERRRSYGIGWTDSTTS